MPRRVLTGATVVCLVMLAMALPVAAEAVPITNLGAAPAIEMGNLYQATAQALANAAHNATAAQQNAAVTFQAATVMGVSTLLRWTLRPRGPPPPGSWTRRIPPAGAATSRSLTPTVSPVPRCRR